MPPLCRNSRAILAAFLVFWLFGVSSPALAGSKDLDWNALPAASLTENGQARIIVGFAVADYDELAAASRSHKVVTPEEAGQSRTAALAADAALAGAMRRGADAMLAELPAKAYTVHRTYSALPYAALSVTPEGLAALRENPKVTSIEVDEAVPLPLPVTEKRAKGGEAEPESALTDQPASNLNWGPAKIGADTAWARGYTGQGWHVAILDTGIRRTHEFFAGKTIVEACFSADRNCPGGTTTAYGTGSAAHYSSSLTGWDHGTHCAGIATGKKADGSAAGVAKDANLIAVQVFSIFTSSGDVRSYSSDQLAGLNYVYSLRNTYSIAAASMSLGGGSYSSACDSDSRKTAIDNLRSVNIATTIAAGNDYSCSGIGGPACISTSIAVGSSTSSDTESGFSNWYPGMVTIFAPGSSIYSSTGDSDTSYASWNGTSMATPHVAGAWALLRQNRPNDSVSAILTRLLAGSPSVSTTCPSGGSRPRVFIPAALQATASLPLLQLLLGQ
jgi:subtilisin family serine protease